MSNKYSDGRYQEKVGEYVAKHVHHCLSTLVSEVAPKFMEGVFPDYSEEVYFDLFRIKPDQGDCENAGFQFFEYGGDWYYVQSLSKPDPEDHDLTELEAFDSIEDAIQECARENDVDGADVYEHWLVSDHLAYKLKEHGQTVVDDFFGLTVWCRCTTGQAILLDRVICDIYDELTGGA